MVAVEAESLALALTAAAAALTLLYLSTAAYAYLRRLVPGLATNSIFPFCEKTLICLEGKSMTPHRGDTILFRSSQQLLRLRLGPLKGVLS